jgi:hypothetical protein
MVNKQGDKCLWKSLLPHILVFLWLVFLASTIWWHATESAQTPHHDPITYMQKAMNFWRAVNAGGWFNPLDIEPTTRPPGTILMSYPFGFSSEYRGFYFRSAFLPILLVIISVYWVLGFSGGSSSGWYVALMALLLSAISIFYSFDVSEMNPRPVHWGLVDNFQTGVAALAAAGYVRSFQRKSLMSLFLGTLFGSLTLLIKPSGLMVMALLGFTWVIGLGMDWIWDRKANRGVSGFQRYVVIGAFLISAIDFIVILLCIYSKYFSAENFEYAKGALVIMKTVLNGPMSLILSLLINNVGILFVLWFLFKVLLFSVDRFRMGKRYSPIPLTMAVMMVSALIIWGLGAWYWLIVQAGGNQVRYFYPFFLMGVIYTVPVSLWMFQKSGRGLRLAEGVLCALTALNIGVLMAQDSPPLAWQRFTGVNVTVGQDREVVQQAYAFLAEIRRQNRPAKVYTFFYNSLTDIFVTVGFYEGMVRPTLQSFQTVSPVDWIHGFVVKTDQLSDVDYILVRKDLGVLAEKLFDQKIETYYSEVIVFQAWLCMLNEAAGVRIASDGTVLRLLQIVDRKAFQDAISSFVGKHEWRSEFVDANPNLKWDDPAKSGD